jgi:hypothetical protein
MTTAPEMQEAQRLALKRDLGVIAALLALPFVKKHDTRFDNETAFVAPLAQLAEVSAVVERYLSAPVKTASGPMPRELWSSPVLEAMGGAEDGQTFYLKDLGQGLSIYVAYWPWNGRDRFTIKVGVHVVEG